MVVSSASAAASILSSMKNLRTSLAFFRHVLRLVRAAFSATFASGRLVSRGVVSHWRNMPICSRIGWTLVLVVRPLISVFQNFTVQLAAVRAEDHAGRGFRRHQLPVRSMPWVMVRSIFLMAETRRLGTNPIEKVVSSDSCCHS